MVTGSRPILQSKFDSYLALIEGSTLYQRFYTNQWISRGSYRLISDRTCGKIARVAELVDAAALEAVN